MLDSLFRVSQGKNQSAGWLSSSLELKSSILSSGGCGKIQFLTANGLFLLASNWGQLSAHVVAFHTGNWCFFFLHFCLFDLNECLSKLATDIFPLPSPYNFYNWFNECLKHLIYLITRFSIAQQTSQNIQNKIKPLKIGERIWNELFLRKDPILRTFTMIDR